VAGVTTAEQRIDPPPIAGETPMLTAWLDWHRATLRGKCSGLGPAQLRERAVPPSALSLLGLVRHLAEVERAWFRRFVGAQPDHRWCTPEDEDADFNGVDGADVGEAFAAWDEEVARARDVVAVATSLDQTFTGGRGHLLSLRWLLVHMIQEYARHNGHADLLRERLDGVTGY
jgi:uncharacterized damage-inducible protein DinB